MEVDTRTIVGIIDHWEVHTRTLECLIDHWEVNTRNTDGLIEYSVTITRLAVVPHIGRSAIRDNGGLVPRPVMV